MFGAYLENQCGDKVLMKVTIYENKNTDYLVYTRESYCAIVEEVLRHLPPNTKYKVLELGCGSGAFSRYFLQDINCELVGVDISENLISKANSILAEAVTDNRARFVCQNVSPENLGLLDLSNYDVIFSGAFLHHLPVVARKLLLSYIAVHAKSDAVFAAFEPNIFNPAIRIQYMYETRLNEDKYDRSEFPLCPNDSTPWPSISVSFLDVGYRVIPITESKIRYGLIGKVLYKLGSRLFGFIYSRVKRLRVAEKYIKDYFLIVSRNVAGI